MLIVKKSALTAHGRPFFLLYIVVLLGKNDWGSHEKCHFMHTLNFSDDLNKRFSWLHKKLSYAKYVSF